MSFWTNPVGAVGSWWFILLKPLLKMLPSWALPFINLALSKDGKDVIAQAEKYFSDMREGKKSIPEVAKDVSLVIGTSIPLAAVTTLIRTWFEGKSGVMPSANLPPPPV